MRVIECYVLIGCFVLPVVPDDLGGADSVFFRPEGGSFSITGPAHWPQSATARSFLQRCVSPEATSGLSPNKELCEPFPDSVDRRRRDEQAMAE